MMTETLHNIRQALQTCREKYGISSSTLKMIAIITMLIDHTAATIVSTLRWHYYASASPDVLSILTNLNFYMRRIGRLAFPIFCYMIVEGYFHTRNVKKYALRLFVFALISEFPFDYALHHTQSLMTKQNVYWTLLIGLLVIWAVDELLRGYTAAQFLIMCFGMVLAYFMRTDYSFRGVFLIESLYILKFSRPLQLLGGAAYMENYEKMPTPLAFLLIWLYNGKKGRSMKYFFYLFYPVHLLILGFITYTLLPMGFGY